MASSIGSTRSDASSVLEHRDSASSQLEAHANELLDKLSGNSRGSRTDILVRRQQSNARFSKRSKNGSLESSSSRSSVHSRIRGNTINRIQNSSSGSNRNSTSKLSKRVVKNSSDLASELDQVQQQFDQDEKSNSDYSVDSD
eukprot:TRINITY_DN10701_c0_g1_i1.p1 TRINITY_DN10701_c0_g1~~TRINITY_DN10701_c0_g1_i1.p1  ORF type:complete len:154 (-),score=33.44 TRINITY_DN10701_c0_g1_i1:25-450(-)